MDFSAVEIRYPGKPCSGLRIRGMQLRLGKVLPKDFAQFVRTTGGGVIGLKNCYVKGEFGPSNVHLEFSVDVIYGNGVAKNDSDVDLVTMGKFLAEEWEIPDEVLLIGHAESGMHEAFVINYGLREFPKHAVLYCDNESDDGFIQLAGSFSEFVGLWGPSPDYDGKPLDPNDGQWGKVLAREGVLGPSLVQAIEACGVADMEQVVREAASGIAKGNIMEMSLYEESFRFQDLLFYLAQQLWCPSNIDSWVDRNNDVNPYRLAGLLGDSFLDPDGDTSVKYVRYYVETWWEDRTGKGVLVETPQGFKLDEEYVAGIIQSLR